jgi:hypothetical protein
MSSDAVSQRVAVTDVLGVGPGTGLALATGPLTGRVVPDRSFNCPMPFAITGVTWIRGLGGPATLTLSDPISARLIHPSPSRDAGRWYGYRVSTGPNVAVRYCAGRNAAAQQYTLDPDVLGILPGDIGLRCTYASGTDLGDTGDSVFTVTAVNAATKTITVAARYGRGAADPTPAVAGSGAGGYVHIYRLSDRGAVTSSFNETVVISAGFGSDAQGNLTTVAVAHWGEAWVPTDWEPPAEVTAPAAKPPLIAGTPRRHRLGTVAMEATDEPNVLGNGYLTQWAPTAPNPDGLFNRWTLGLGGHKATGRRNVTALDRIETGGTSLRLRRARSGYLSGAVAVGTRTVRIVGSAQGGTSSASSPDFEAGASIYINPDGVHTAETVVVQSAAYDAVTTAWVYTTVAPLAFAHNDATLVSEYGGYNVHRIIAPPSGVVSAWMRVWMEGPVDGSPGLAVSLILRRPVTADPAGISEQRLTSTAWNTWDTLAILGYEVPPGDVVEIEIGLDMSLNVPNAWKYSAWVDRVGLTDTSYLPDPEPDWSNANPLYHAARRFLVERVTGRQTYEVRMLDLGRLGPASAGNPPFTLGGQARLHDPLGASSALLRVIELRPDYLVEGETGVTLAIPAPTLTGLTAAAP